MSSYISRVFRRPLLISILCEQNIPRRGLFNSTSPSIFGKTQRSAFLGGPYELRFYSNKFLSQEELRSKLNRFQDLFVEARLSIKDAEESLDTTYFEEDLAEAKQATEAAMKAYREILGEVDKAKSEEIERANAMKLKQLQEEFTVIAEHYKEDH